MDGFLAPTDPPADGRAAVLPAGSETPVGVTVLTRAAVKTAELTAS